MRTALTGLVLLVPLALAQPGPLPTPTALYPNTGTTQTNQPNGNLIATGVFQAPGNAPSAPVPFLGPGSVSSTVCYEAFGSTTFPSPGQWTINGSVNGLPNQPFALAVGWTIGGTFCGGFAGWPCMTGPLLLGDTVTSAGRVHLGPNFVVLLDGIFGTAPPAILDASGTFPLTGTGVIDTVTNGGVEVNFALQALVADPTLPAGMRFTAAGTVSQWVFYL